MTRPAVRIDNARRLWWPMIGALLVALLLAGCAYTLVRGDHVDSKQAEKIETGIQEIRELHFKQPVPLVIKTRDQAEAMIEAVMMRDYTDSDLQVSGTEQRGAVHDPARRRGRDAARA